MVAYVVGAWLFIVILGNLIDLVDGDDKKADSKPSPSASATGTPIQWVYQGQGCSDGWHSSSIGKRGACSHHGGVITVYQSNIGGLVTICGPRYQPKTLERAQELADSGGNVTCDFE
ncbi:hypothetical protein [Streptomyces sp. NPDC002403]